MQANGISDGISIGEVIQGSESDECKNKRVSHFGFAKRQILSMKSAFLNGSLIYYAQKLQLEQHLPLSG
jgi:hypothetical protein